MKYAIGGESRTRKDTIVPAPDAAAAPFAALDALLVTALATAAALTEMILPGMTAIVGPVLVGFLLGPAALAGTLAGALAVVAKRVAPDVCQNGIRPVLERMSEDADRDVRFFAKKTIEGLR